MVLKFLCCAGPQNQSRPKGPNNYCSATPTDCSFCFSDRPWAFGSKDGSGAGRLNWVNMKRLRQQILQIKGFSFTIKIDENIELFSDLIFQFLRNLDKIANILCPGLKSWQQWQQWQYGIGGSSGSVVVWQYWQQWQYRQCGSGGSGGRRSNSVKKQPPK